MFGFSIFCAMIVVVSLFVMMMNDADSNSALFVFVFIAGVSALVLSSAGFDADATDNYRKHLCEEIDMSLVGNEVGVFYCANPETGATAIINKETQLIDLIRHLPAED